MSNTVRNTEPAAIPLGSRSRAPVPAVASACRILEALASAGHENTLTELSRRLDLPKSTLHNQLSTLQVHGLVDRDDESRRFRLGSTLIPLGLAASRHRRSIALVAEQLPHLAAEHHLTFAVAHAVDPYEAVLVDCAHPAEDIHVGLTPGSRYGVFHGAVGKCLLAALQPDEAEHLVRSAGIPRHTPRTIVDAKSLLADVRRARQRDWSTSAGEFKENHAVAAPLRNGGGDLELVLLAVAFPAQLPIERFEKVGAALAETARAVEAATGANGRLLDHEAAA